MKYVKHALATLLIILLAMTGVQASEVPGDLNGDKIVSDDELIAAERLAQEGTIASNQLEEIRNVHENYPKTITDSAGRNVTIYKPLDAVIPLSMTTYEPIFVLGAIDKIAGVRTDLRDAYYPWISGLENKPTIGGYKGIDYEKVIELKPDMVFVSRYKPEINEKLKLANIPLFVLEFAQMDRFDDELQILGELLDREDRADEFISWRHNYLNQIIDRTENIDPKVKVFIATGNGPWGTSTNGSGSHDVVTAAGGHNIGGEIQGESGGVAVDPEWVLKKDPEIVICLSWLAGEPPSNLTGYDITSPDNVEQYLKTQYGSDVLKDIEAGKKHRIHVLYGPITLGSCSAPIGVYYCAKWFYPEAFKDLEPEKLNEEYFEKWMGVPYAGIWAYPQAS